MGFIIAFDQGTSSCRSIIFDLEGNVVSMAQREFPQYFPQAGWVEHNANEIWNTQILTAEEAMCNAGLDSKDIEGLGITNQRETSILWDRETGEPISNAIVWQDRRTSQYCSQINATHGKMIREKTGLEVDAYFSASKVRWLLNNIEGARTLALRGNLCFGTVDSWLIWKLTEKKLHVTDFSNASRTMLFNIHTCEWDIDLLELFEVPESVLPTVRSSSEILGTVEIGGVLRNVPISGVAGDQQAALFGQGCFSAGDSKNTYGTGCFFLQNTGNDAVVSANKLLTTIAWKTGNDLEYALEGSVFIGGAVIQWLRDGLGIIKNSAEVESLATSVTDSGGVLFVPAFAGLGTPYWNQNARGTLLGITRGTSSAHIARAALEAIAFQSTDLIAAVERDSGKLPTELRVDGGATRNELLMQFQADILQIPVVRGKIFETSALGVAYLSGLACGFWKSKTELSAHWKADKKFVPKMNAKTAHELLQTWNRAVERSLDWEK
ncbi:MAG: glycerol kinase GlpK [Pyrinomonadaceae bacterium]